MAKRTDRSLPIAPPAQLRDRSASDAVPMWDLGRAYGGEGGVAPALRTVDSHAADTQTPPTATARLIVREPLIRQLDESSWAPLTVLIAPAGFGKTTLLQQWASRQNRRVAWLALDSAGAPLAWFAGRLRSAISHATAFEIYPELAEILPTQSLSADVRELTERFTDLLTALQSELVIIIEDYTLIGDARVHQLVSALIANLPPKVRFIISARTQPSLPLARLRVRGLLCEIDAESMRFDLDDARRFLVTSMGLSLSDSALRDIQRRTEGWVAGLQLAALSVRNRHDITAAIESFTGSNRLVSDYLASEVISGLPDDLRAFLLETSILTTLSADLCDAVVSGQSSQQYLTIAEADGLFLTPLDTDRKRFRYHQLFREQLNSILVQTYDAERIAALHRNAAAWYKANGYRIEAVRHSVDAGNWRQVVELIRAYAFPVIMVSKCIRAWLLSLPDEALRGQNRLTLWASFAALSQGDYAGYAKYFERVRPAIEASDEADLKSLVYSIKATAEYHLGDAESALKEAIKALDVAPSLSFVERLYATHVRGSSLMIMGRPEEAETWIRKALAMNDGDELLLGYRAVSLSHLGRVLTMQGRLDEAERALLKSVELFQASGLDVSPRCYVFLADVYLVRNEIDLADIYLARAKHAIGSTGLALIVPLYQLIATRVQWAKGVMYETLDTLNELVPWSIQNDAILFRRRAEAYRARVWVRQGRLDQAREWAESIGVTTGENVDYKRQEAYITYIDLILSEPDRDGTREQILRSFEWIKALQGIASASGRVTDLLRLTALEALLLDAIGRRDMAIKLLETTLKLGAPQRQIWAFLEAGEDMRLLLDSAPGLSNRVPFAAEVRAAFGARAGAPAPTGGGQLDYEPLTEREREVLSLLAAGLTNQEIATSLYVSENTVKTHIKHIFSKLDVRNRTEALVQAHKLDLL